MNEADADQLGAWPVSWEENRRAQLLSIASLTPAQRLEWLEEALQLALRTGALQRLREDEARQVREIFDR